MKVQRVTIDHFKNISHLDADLNGMHIYLLGDNAVGKSSFIQAIQCALGSENIPDNAIQDGESEGKIEVIAGENGEQYTFFIKLKENGRHVVEVTAPNGLKDHRKGTIAQIVGDTAFDVFKFVELSSSSSGRKKQVEIVKSFFPEDTQTQLKLYEQEVEAAFNERTEVNREVKHLEGALAESGLHKEDFATFKDRIDTTELQTQFQEAVGNNNEIQGVEARKQERADKISEIDEEIQKLQDKRAELFSKQQEAITYLENNKPVDVEPIKEQMNKADEHNRMAEKVASFKNQSDKLENSRTKSGELTVLIDTKRQAIEDAIKDIGLPVEGLEFDIDQLLYNGRTVSVETLSTSEIMHIGIQLQMAKNPNVKILTIARGESLGAKRIEEIVKLADDHGYQIIMEQVQRGTEELVIEYMKP